MGASPTIQIFGRTDSAATRHCLRFFKERRVEVSFVDVARRPPASAELRRFSQRLGVRALLDEEGRAYRDSGLGYLRMSDEEVFERLLGDPRLLRLPLVRNGAEVTIGRDEATWRRWQLR